MRRRPDRGGSGGVTAGRLLGELVRSPKDLGLFVAGILVAVLVTLPLPAGLRLLVAWVLTCAVAIWVMLRVYDRVQGRGGR